jgi:hypothetical protein
MLNDQIVFQSRFENQIYIEDIIYLLGLFISIPPFFELYKGISKAEQV